MKKKKYEVREESESRQEEFICNRIPHTHCKCQKFIIIIIIIIPQRTDSRHLALTSAVLGLQTFLYCAKLISLLMLSNNKQFFLALPSHLSHSFPQPLFRKLPIQYFPGILLLSFRTNSPANCNF